MDDALWTLTAALAAAAMVALLLDGGALTARAGWVHRLGVPFRRGVLELPDRLPPDTALPRAARGPNAVWLSEHTVGYWSGRVRIGFRDSFGFDALRGMGVACSGTLEIAADRHTGRFTERVRPGPLAMILFVSAAGALLWRTAELPLPALIGPPLFFLIFFGIFVALSARHLRDVRRHLGVDA